MIVLLYTNDKQQRFLLYAIFHFISVFFDLSLCFARALRRTYHRGAWFRFFCTGGKPGYGLGIP